MMEIFFLGGGHTLEQVVDAAPENESVVPKIISVMASYSIEHTDLHVRMHGGYSHWLQA